MLGKHAPELCQPEPSRVLDLVASAFGSWSRETLLIRVYAVIWLKVSKSYYISIEYAHRNNFFVFHNSLRGMRVRSAVFSQRLQPRRPHLGSQNSRFHFKKQGISKVKRFRFGVVVHGMRGV